jgi:hypothetical protein
MIKFVVSIPRRIARQLRRPSVVSVFEDQYRALVADAVEIFPSQHIVAHSEFATSEHINYTLEAKRAFVLNDVIVWPSLSVAGTSKMQILAETAFSANRLRRMLDGDQFRSSGEMAVDQACITVDCGNWSNYYHTLIDIWPRLYALNELGYHDEIVLLMTRDLLEFERPIVDALLPPNVIIKHVPPDITVRAAKYIWLPYLSGDSAGYLPPAYLRWFRTRIFSHIGLEPPSGPQERIYISRQKATKRRYQNENELVAALSDRGFKAYYLEDLSLLDQIRLFSQAEIVFGRHGAGFTNLLFASDCKVVEHMAARVLNHYRLLSVALHLPYANILSAEGSKNADVLAPIDEITATIDRLNSTEMNGPVPNKDTLPC